MAKKYYCSLCGAELTYSCKAVKGKGLIMNLIAPHECEGFSIALNPDGKPTAEEVINAARPLGTLKKDSEKSDAPHSLHLKYGEFDDKRDGIKSTAPASLINNMKNLTNSGVDNVEG